MIARTPRKKNQTDVRIPFPALSHDGQILNISRARKYLGNVGSSQTINLTVTFTPLKHSKLFPTVAVAAVSIVAVVAVGAGLSVYFKKRKHIG